MGISESANRPTVTPRIITDDPAGVADFLRRVLGAEGEAVGDRPVELRLGDSLVLVSDGGGVHTTTPAFLLVQVEDTDAAFARAVEAGATAEESPTDMPWGDRRATVRDKWGNTWQLTTSRS
ncbi:VOC family protein [Amorphoplanes nipponensis]|uniref:Glyoxalase n=1 Tax=Actinoplanes nipponensis TaxID=135950 RepID=A0A919MNM2_9ACTN|nr:VOC family protein [Actinoplanes nipponensis]GIE51726.1 glyoxalase [Actinoplanes nipponensis]